VFRARILRKYDAAYFRCPSCGFIQTEEPYWLPESYSSAVNDIDLGLISRAITGASFLEGILLSCFNKTGKFIDYGGGYGLLVRMMRDRGYDFYWQDRYCENIFARHFIASSDMRFELLTAFEVFEHLADPRPEIRAMLGYSDNLLFSTLLVPPGIQEAADWWYFGPEHGQHISFYTTSALQIMANEHGLHLASDGVSLHLLSRKPVSERLFRFFANGRLLSRFTRRVLRRRLHKQSLLMDDFKMVSGYKL
jgi:hypothetical protein